MGPTTLEGGSLLEAAPDAIVVVDGVGTIVLVNAQAEELLGYDRTELIGQPVEVLVPDAAREGHPARRERYASEPRPRPMGAGADLAARRRDGSTFPAEISLSAIQTPDGVVYAAAIRDATERRRAEAKFRGLLEAAPDAIVCVDADGIITLVNTQALRVFGYNRDELVGTPIEVLVPDDVRDTHPAHRSSYFSDPRTRPMGAGRELTARRRDGSTFPAEISLSALEADDEVLVLAAVRDVTERLQSRAERERLRTQSERERLERQLQQSQRLESLGQLAGGVAHDFNNLLGAIMNYAHFVAEELAAAAAGDLDRPWESVSRDVDQIQRAAERAAGLTHQLLAFARREVVRPQVVDLNEIVRNVEQLLKRTIGEHVDLATDLSPTLETTKVDPGQLEQVLVNLAVNARDAMPNGGQLRIQTENVIVDDAASELTSQLAPGMYVRLRVSDTGRGMRRDVVERAFEPFYSTKAKGEGSGLGLATVYGIITQAGGTVTIYSEEGLGTTVSTLLPVTEEAPAPVEEPIESVRAASGETVLLVEDEELVREVTIRVLRRNGYEVLAASGGAEAIELVSAHPGGIHVILSDVVMPNMQGREVVERVRELRPDIKVIFMSGYAEPVLTAQGTLEPDVTLIEKPFSVSSLLTALRQVLDD